jgi:hypothetical protein
MARFHTTPKKNGTKALSAAFVLAAALTPAPVFAAEREGTVLFFSFEDLKQAFSHPTPPQPSLNFSWNNQETQNDQMGPVERNYFWGDGLGIDGYAHPGVRQPLWGY